MDRMSRLIVTEGTISTISWWIALAKSVQEMQEFNDRANICHSNTVKLQVMVKTCDSNVSLSQMRGLKPKYSLSRILWGRCCLVARRCSGVVLHLRGLGVGF